MVERGKRRLADHGPVNAGMAAQIERLGSELAEAREQFAATSEVLAVIGRSASDLERVLETVVESARRLCGADAGQVLLVDGDRYRLAYGSGMPSEFRELIADNPVVLDRGTLAGRVGLDRRATQITDVLTDPDYGRADAQQVGGFRTIMGVPPPATLSVSPTFRCRHRLRSALTAASTGLPHPCPPGRWSPTAP